MVCSYRCGVASTGVAAGGELHATVYPLILRGVRLLGVDSTLPWCVDESMKNIYYPYYYVGLD